MNVDLYFSSSYEVKFEHLNFLLYIQTDSSPYELVGKL